LVIKADAILQPKVKDQVLLEELLENSVITLLGLKRFDWTKSVQIMKKILTINGKKN